MKKKHRSLKQSVSTGGYKKRVIRKYLIIDGYNLINAVSELKKLTKDSLEEAREKLIDKIIEYSQFAGYEAIVVFDAYRVKGPAEVVENRGNVQIVYTKQFQTADSYIEKFVSSVSRYDEVCVVTDDYAEQQIAMGKGAVRITTREFKQDLNSAFNQINTKTSTNENVIHKNRVEDNINSDVYLKLEKMRRRK